jgi:hypothetical protein
MVGRLKPESAHAERFINKPLFKHLVGAIPHLYHPDNESIKCPGYIVSGSFKYSSKDMWYPCFF